MSNTNSIFELLDDFKEIAEEYNQDPKRRYNIFHVLNIEHREEILHSRFIAHLLNPNGKHSYGSKFLELFMEKIENDIPEDFRINYKNSVVKIEYPLKDENRGRIDILIYDNDNIIAIENKIYAKDQSKQLKRYYDGLKKEYENKNILILYLTLEGKDASKQSSDGIEYYKISYQKHIIKWLKCLQLGCLQKKIDWKSDDEDSIILQQAIRQYKESVEKLIRKFEMEKKIKKVLTDEVLTNIIKNEDKINSLMYILGNNEEIENQLIIAIIEKIMKYSLEENDCVKINDFTYKINNDFEILFKYHNKILYYGLSKGAKDVIYKIDKKLKEQNQEETIEIIEDKNSISSFRLKITSNISLNNKLNKELNDKIQIISETIKTTIEIIIKDYKK